MGAMQARKYLDGARLAAVQQPPFERVLRLDFSGREGDASLLAELIERRANLILLQGERIQDAVRRVGPQMNRYRSILPGQLYVSPPPQPKLDPTDVTELRLRQLLEATDRQQPVWRVLVSGVAGVSPLFAREVVYRAMGDARTPVSACERITPLLDAFLEALDPYWEHRWQPGVVLDTDGTPRAFAPYPLTHLGSVEPSESISQALTRYYAPTTGIDAYQAAKAPVRKELQKARERLVRKRDTFTAKVPEPSRLETLRKKGELVLAFSATITPGQTELQTQYEPEEPPLIITLDPTLSPVANAQAFFREYEKAKRAAAGMPELIAAADLDIAFLEQLETDLELATSWPEIDQVRESLAAAGWLPKPTPSRPRGAVSRPLRVVSEDGIVILVGRNSRQNELLTFKQAAPEDLWLHAQGLSGGHVIIKSGGRSVPERTIIQAARLAAGYSAARYDTRVPVDVVPRKRVRRQKGAKARPGMVVYTGARTVWVKPQQEDR